MQTKTQQVVLEPKTAEFIKALEAAGGPPIYKLSVEEARKVLIGAQSQPKDMKAVDIEERTIDAGPSGKVSLTIVRPSKQVNPIPAVMFFHGGGWILGNFKTHERLVREIAHGADVAVIFVNFTPSPESHYPTAMEECYAATKYVAEHAKDFNVKEGHLAVCGDSVGGNMAIAMTMLAKERGGPKIARQVLFYPVTDAGLDTESYKKFAEGPWLTKPAMEWFWNAYAPDPKTREQNTASPLRAPIDSLKGLPPATIITAENDVLRDEGEAYAHNLSQAGVEVTAVRCLATIHDFVMLDALRDTPAAKNGTHIAVQALLQTFAK
jgi:acetyl esterase